MAQVGMGGVDAHKRSLTIAVVDAAGVALHDVSFGNDGPGVARALTWLAGLPVDLARIGVEGSGGHGRHLAQALVAAGHDVREVPPRRTAERRRARRRPKTDVEDARAIARATAAEPGLGPVKAGAGLGQAHQELVVLLAHRDMLVARRKSMLNQAEAALCALPLALRDQIGTGKAVAPRLKAATLLPHDGAGAATARLRLLAELAADLTETDRRIRVLDKRLEQLVGECGSTLTQEAGIGTISAARLLAEVGDPARFRSEAAFNRWWGGAPVAVSSGEGHGDPIRHRLDLLGNRKTNSVLHLMSITQARYHPDAQAYLTRKHTEGKTRKEARRAHKTLLGRRIIRRMWADRRRQLHTTRQAPTTAA